jgi:hypothetical protein
MPAFVRYKCGPFSLLVTPEPYLARDAMLTHTLFVCDLSCRSLDATLRCHCSKSADLFGAARKTVDPTRG